MLDPQAGLPLWSRPGWKHELVGQPFDLDAALDQAVLLDDHGQDAPRSPTAPEPRARVVLLLFFLVGYVDSGFEPGRSRVVALTSGIPCTTPQLHVLRAKYVSRPFVWEALRETSLTPDSSPVRAVYPLLAEIQASAPAEKLAVVASNYASQQTPTPTDVVRTYVRERKQQGGMPFDVYLDRDRSVTLGASAPSPPRVLLQR